MRQLLRVIFAVATFAIVWLVAKPAFAAGAPVCDPRGAVAFAPPPQQQDPEQTLDIVVNEDDCSQSPLDKKHLVPNRAPAPHAAFAAADAATTSAFVCILHASAERVPAPVADVALVRPGFSDSLERPPRA